MLLSRQRPSLSQVVSELHRAMKFCKPLAEPDGSIKPGEGKMCRSVGNVREGVTLPFIRMPLTEPRNACGCMTNADGKVKAVLARRSA